MNSVRALAMHMVCSVCEPERARWAVQWALAGAACAQRSKPCMLPAGCAMGASGQRRAPQRTRPGHAGREQQALALSRPYEVITPTLWDAQHRDIDLAIADFQYKISSSFVTRPLKSGFEVPLKSGKVKKKVISLGDKRKKRQHFKKHAILSKSPRFAKIP